MLVLLCVNLSGTRSALPMLPLYLKNVIADQHKARNRPALHVAFMSRIIRNWKIFPRAIAPDERAAVCIGENAIHRWPAP